MWQRNGKGEWGKNGSVALCLDWKCDVTEL